MPKLLQVDEATSHHNIIPSMRKDFFALVSLKLGYHERMSLLSESSRMTLDARIGECIIERAFLSIIKI